LATRSWPSVSNSLARLAADFIERGDAFIVNRASGLINV
jgi:hypothetical protein